MNPKPSSSYPSQSADQAFPGIDIAKATFQAALLLPGGRMPEQSFNNTPEGFARLRSWVQKHAAGLPVHAVMEATGVYYEDPALCPHGWIKTPSVVNPRLIKACAGTSLLRAKTDAVDARLIARFAAVQRPAAWLPPSPAQRALQELTRRLQSLIATRTAEKIRPGRARTNPVRQSLERHLTDLEKEIGIVEAAISGLVAGDLELSSRQRLLCSIPGIGAVTASRLLSEISDPARFGSARQLAAHGGLTPRREQSGTSTNRRGGICRIGSSRLRACLYFPAITAIRRNPPLTAFAERLRAAGKPSKLIITAVMRKLLHLVFGILKSNQPFDHNFLKQSS